MFYVAAAEHGLPVALCGPFDTEDLADLFCETAISPAMSDGGDLQFGTVRLVTPEQFLIDFDPEKYNR